MRRRDSLSEASVAVMRHAFAFASELGHGFVGSEHFLWSLCGETASLAGKALAHNGIDQQLVREMIETYVHSSASDVGRKLGLSAEADQMLERADQEARNAESKKIEPEHILIAILIANEDECSATRLIWSVGGSPDHIADIVWDGLEKKQEEFGGEGDKKKKETKTLNRFSRDLTEMALKGELDPVIGRQQELDRCIQILSRRTKNNPVLIGEPGVGKTAIAEAMAQRIVDKQVPKNLEGKRVMSLDLSKMLSGTRYRGDFEERIKNYLEEVEQSGDVILFIDELHTLIRTGAAEGAMDAASVFKPALSRGNIQVIGATTISEYRRYIEKDAALERRFQPVNVDEPTKEQTLAILQGLRERYEQFHELEITQEAMEAAVELSSRYIQDRFLPDKAIDVIDEAASRMRTRHIDMPQQLRELEKRIAELNQQKLRAAEYQDYEEAIRLRDEQNELRQRFEQDQGTWLKREKGSIGKEDIAAVISTWTGIPVTALNLNESEKLLGLEDALHKRLIGQEEAVTTVAKAIRRSRVGIKEEGHPIGSFMFLGPTGVGKTELCRALAEVLFQDEDAIIRVDMSEYMERHTVSKLIGSPPGYVGYDEGGQLTEKVRRKPYSIVLFDEIEKAHPDVWNVLLQIMDDGRLTDAQGRKVDFTNTVIVMTSNIGARDIVGKNALGFATGDRSSETRPLKELREKVLAELKKTFQPEFLNRIDDIIVFHQLDKEQIERIALKLLDEVKERAKKLSLQLEVEPEAVALLVEQGFDPVYGARPLKRVIQSKIEDAVAEIMLKQQPRWQDKLVIRAAEKEIVAAVEWDKDTVRV